MEPQQNQSMPVEPTPVSPIAPTNGEHKKVGPIISALVILIIIIIIALFVLASNVNKQVVPVDTAMENIANDSAMQTDQNPAPSVSVAPITNTADDLQSLQADLNASINGVDAQSI